MGDTAQGPLIVAVVGTTASGKTGFGVQLAEALETGVISADSQLVYRELDIGTAKPTPAETRGVCHYMMDRVLPTEAYSVARYQEEATAVLEQMLVEGKTPVVVGGSGFYIRALLEESLVPPVPPDETFREEMALVVKSKGPAYLHAQLAVKDPERAAVLHPNDTFRVVRALEIIHATGKPVPKNLPKRHCNVRWVGLMYDNRDVMRRRIDERIDAMCAAGWLDEVKALIETYGADAHALQVAHGYPEWVQYLQGTCTYEEALAQVQINVHQYARRQLTWFRRNPDIHWICVDTASALQEQVRFINDVRS